MIITNKYNFQIFLKKISEMARKGPQLFVSEQCWTGSLFVRKWSLEIQEGTVKIVAVQESKPLLGLLVPEQK